MKTLDLQFSVFNGHVNDADKRARELMKWIAADWLDDVEKIEKDGDGIMAIFNQDATLATICYSSIVAAYVNEHREDPDMPAVGINLTVWQLAAVISNRIPRDENRAYKLKANLLFVEQLHEMVKLGGVWGWPATATIWEKTEDGFRRTK
jgi:hypothetical protein